MKLPYSFNNNVTDQKNIKFVSVPKINAKKLIALDIEESNNSKCLKFAKVNNVAYNYGEFTPFWDWANDRGPESCW